MPFTLMASGLFPEAYPCGSEHKLRLGPQSKILEILMGTHYIFGLPF